jgi:hypothetical protein
MLPNMKLIRRPNPHSTLLQIDLHSTQPRRMPRHQPHRHPLRHLPHILVKRLPVQLLQIEVVRQVHTCIRTCGGGPACVFELGFVHVDGDVGADEVLEAAGVVEVEVADDDGFDVVDGIAGGGDGGGEVVAGFVDGAWEEVGGWGGPGDVEILGAAGFEEDEAEVWVVDEAGDEGEVAAGGGWVGV